MNHILLRLAYYIQAKSALGEIHAFIKSHPEPKGVSVLVDACRRWGIDYELGVISVHELHLVPRYSLLLFPRFEDHLILREETDGIAHVFHQQKGEINVQVESLQGHWSGSVLLIDAESEHHLPKGGASSLSKPMNWLAVIVLLLTGLQLYHWGQVGIMLLPVLGGMFFSVAAYLTGMGIGSKIAEQVCQSGDQKGACSTLLQSPSARVLGVPWSLLGVLYFGIHSLLMLSAVHSPAQESILTIDALLWFSALPVLGYSLYFQFFLLRAWCRLCLLIGLMLLTGMALTSLLIPIAIGEVHAALPYLLWSLLFVLMVLALIAGHTLACKWITLKQDQRGYHAFLYNPAAVQARLSQSSQLDYFPDLLALAGSESQPILQIVLSLHCSHCKRLFDDLMQKNTWTRSSRYAACSIAFWIRRSACPCVSGDCYGRRLGRSLVLLV